ncbi:uncharacterized protein FIESC28_09938 [Fusarium coffeatum]|uniref:Uncharacterized protein n=1 Tax=Fusarium coffeatum TaxID=231269 RepID=A0A366QZA3_9HYPO|nr:uncharacterized protein FIESC28_09938 [Fusarium coffeatum]RBR09330.1 hypothetical protein FIESC28_09938 [Fusarium coffeatum]
MRFILCGSSCKRAPDEEGDIQTIADIEHETTTSSEQNADSVGPITSAHTDLRSSLPQLLRTSRQIHNEARALLYNNNCVHVHFGEELRIVLPKYRKEIRHMVINLYYTNPFLHEPEHEEGRYLEAWPELLSGLCSLQLIVSCLSWYNPDEWAEVMKMHLEFIDLHIPPQVKVEVDTDGDESTRQLVNDNISNLCTFERLAAGDEFFKRGVFARSDRDYDLDLDLDERSSEDDDDDDDFIDHNNPYYPLYQLFLKLETNESA